MRPGENYFQVGKSYDVFVTSVKIEDERLCVCAQGNEATRIEFEHLSEILQVTSPKQPRLEHIEKGLLCAGLCKEDGVWYRAVAEKKLADGKWVVKYIDYGNTETKPIEELKPLHADLSTLIPQSTDFVIDEDMNPVSTAGLWTDVAIKTLSDAFIYTEVNMKIKVLADNRIIAESESLTRHLVECGLARQGQSYPNCKYRVGEKAQAYLSHISDHGTVFIQELDSSRKLDKMMDDLNIFYSEKQNRILLPENMFRESNVAVAVYSKDGGFYRVQIKDIDGDSCVAHYIDYGDDEQQEICSLFALHSQFSELEYQAIECSLADISCDNEFNEKVKKSLEIHLESVVLGVEVIGQSSSASRILDVVIKSQGGSNICDSIIAEGFAKLKTVKKETINMDYKYLDLELGESYTVLMSNTEESGTFYAISQHDMGEMNALENRIGHYCFSPDSLLIHNLYKETPCCAFSHSENKWLRGKVLRYDPQGVLVYFVDYGHSQYCVPTSIREMKPEFLTVPCQAFQCYILKDLDAVEILQLKSLYRKMVIVKTIFNSESPNSYLVNLICDGEALFIPKIAGNSSTVYDARPKDYKSLDLNKGDDFEVCVVDVQDLNRMIGRVISIEGSFPAMEKDLERLYSKNVPQSMSFSPGDLCVVQDTKTKQWCRGKIKKVIDSGQFEVFLADYGMTIVSRSNNLYRIHKEFLSTPAQVIEFCFNGVEEQKCSDVDPSQKLELQELLINTIFKSKLVIYNADTNCHELQMENLDGKNINAKVKKILSSFSSPVVLSDILTPDCTTLGTFVDVSVCFVENPECIWIQQSSSEKQLYKLLSDMKSFYSNVSAGDLKLKAPSLNQLCVVQSGTNATDFYRAKVLCTYNDVLEVKLVDYGNDCTVKMSSAKVLIPRFFQPKAQAFQCKINNVKAVGTKWSTDAYKWLCNVLVRQEYHTTGSFISKDDDTYTIKLKVTANGRVIDLAQEMVNEGHASYINPPDVLTTNTSFSKNERPGKNMLQYRNHGVDMVGLELSVKGCFANSLDEFFLTVNDSSIKMKYNSLFKTLAANYATLTPEHDINKDSIYRGMPCAVYNQIWCRGAVLDYINPTAVTVCLVDHGRVINAEVSELKTIDEDLVKNLLPAALRCTLRGLFEPPGATWSGGALEDFRRFISGDGLVCTIHGYMSNLSGMFMMCSLRSPHLSLEDLIVNNNHGRAVSVRGSLKAPSTLKSFFYSNLGVVKGKEDKFYVTHVSDELFYCHLEANFPIIDKLMDDVQRHCEKENTAPVSLNDLSATTMCFAKYDDGLWYRAHFLAVLPASRVKVLFVDYGNVGAVPLSDVRKYEGMIADVHIQALPCKLLDVDFANGPESVSLLNELLLNKLFSGVVAGSVNGRFDLDLYDDGKRINDYVIGALGRRSNMATSTPISEEVESDLKSEQRRLNIEIKDPFIVRVGVSRICSVSDFTNPRYFFIHFKEMDDELRDCCDKVDGFYTALRNSDYAVTVKLWPGCMVCARNRDLTWGRAEVLSVQDNAVQLLFIDTGRMEVIENSNSIKQLVEDMAKWPKFAVMCGLAGVKPKKGDIWSKEAKDCFGNVLDDGELEVRILHKNVNTDLKLVELKISGKSLALELVEKGFAEFIPEECSAFDLSMVYDRTIDIQKFSISTKQFNEKVVISYVDSHRLIYLQAAEKIQKLFDLMLVINEDRDLKTMEKLPLVGQVCLVRYDVDHQYYRSRVLEHTGPNQALVLFVDYGNTDVVSKSSMRMIQVEHAAASEVSFPCTVPCVPSELMPSEVVSKLKELANCGDLKITAHSENVLMTAHAYNLDLNIETDIGKSLSLFDYFAQDSLQKPGIVHNECMNKISGENKEMERNLPGYEYITNLMDTPTTEVYISHVETPSDIYCQLNDNYVLLEELMLKIKSFYKDCSEEDLIKNITELPIGCPCIAKYSEDMAWYRAEVVKAVDGENVEVFFVDYGNTEKINVSDIRRSKPTFCVLPAQAITCSLAHVRNSGSNWSREQIDEFKDLFAEKEFEATFVKYEDKVYDVMLRTKDGTLLNQRFTEGSTESVSEEKLPEITVPYMTLKAGDSHSAYVSYSTSSKDFYVQMEENNLDEIYEKVVADSNSKCEKIFRDGDFCIARSTDDLEWYRGMVTGVTRNHLDVAFIDYGNSCRVEKDFVKSLSEGSASFCRQTVRCSLKVDEKMEVEKVEKVFVSLDLERSYRVEFLAVSDHVWRVNVLADGVDILKSVANEPEKVKMKEEIVRLEKGDGDSKPACSSLPVRNISQGGIHRCVVTQLNTYLDFYVQFKDENHTKLQEVLKNVEPAVESIRTNSQVFLARLSQADWMRCKNLDEMVMCIDSGVAFKREDVEIAKMPAVLFSYPASAVHCRLRTCSEDNSLSLDSIRTLEERMQKQLFCVEFLRRVEESSDQWEVDLLYGNSLLDEVSKEVLPIESYLQTPSIVIYNPDQVEAGIAFNRQQKKSSSPRKKQQLGIFEKYLLEIGKSSTDNESGDENAVKRRNSALQSKPVNCGGVSPVNVLFVRDPDCIFVKLKTARLDDYHGIDEAELSRPSLAEHEVVMFKNNGEFSFGIVLEVATSSEVQVFDIATREVVTMETCLLYAVPTTMKTFSVKKCSLFGIGPAGKAWDRNVVELLRGYLTGDDVTGDDVTAKFTLCLDGESLVRHWLVALYLRSQSVAELLLRGNENVLTNAESFEIRRERREKQKVRRIPLGDLVVGGRKEVGLPIPVRISCNANSSSSLQDSVFQHEDAPDVFAPEFEIYQSPVILENEKSLHSFESEGTLINCKQQCDQQHTCNSDAQQLKPLDDAITNINNANAEDRMPLFVQTNDDLVEKLVENKDKDEQISPPKKKSPLRSPTFIFKSTEKSEILTRDFKLDVKNKSCGKKEIFSVKTENERMPTFVYHGDEESAEEFANSSDEWQTVSVHINKHPTHTNDESPVENSEGNAETDSKLEVWSKTGGVVLSKNLEDFDKVGCVLDAEELGGLDEEVLDVANEEGSGGCGGCGEDVNPETGMRNDTNLLGRSEEHLLRGSKEIYKNISGGSEELFTGLEQNLPEVAHEITEKQSVDEKEDSPQDGDVCGSNDDSGTDQKSPRLDEEEVGIKIEEKSGVGSDLGEEESGDIIESECSKRGFDFLSVDQAENEFVGGLIDSSTPLTGGESVVGCGEVSGLENDRENGKENEILDLENEMLGLKHGRENVMLGLENKREKDRENEILDLENERENEILGLENERENEILGLENERENEVLGLENEKENEVLGSESGETTSSEKVVSNVEEIIKTESNGKNESLDFDNDVKNKILDLKNDEQDCGEILCCNDAEFSTKAIVRLEQFEYLIKDNKCELDSPLNESTSPTSTDNNTEYITECNDKVAGGSISGKDCNENTSLDLANNKATISETMASNDEEINTDPIDDIIEGNGNVIDSSMDTGTSVMCFKTTDTHKYNTGCNVKVTKIKGIQHIDCDEHIATVSNTDIDVDMHGVNHDIVLENNEKDNTQML